MKTSHTLFIPYSDKPKTDLELQAKISGHCELKGIDLNKYTVDKINYGVNIEVTLKLKF